MVIRKKPTLNETIRANEKAIRGMCLLAGKPIPEGFDTPEKVKVQRAPNKPSEVPLEHEEQKNFVKWFRTKHPTILIFAVPNAALRDYKLAAYLRAEGMVAGIPDLHIPEWKTVIEFKRVKGSTISSEQLWFEKYYKHIGWRHFFAYGCADAILKLGSD